MSAQPKPNRRPEDRLRGPLRKVIVGAGRLMAGHEADISSGGSGLRRRDYHDLFTGKRKALLFAALASVVASESNGKRYLRLADPRLFADAVTNTVMLLVVRDAADDGADGSGRLGDVVTTLRKSDRLYCLAVPPGKKHSVEVVKAMKASNPM